MSLAWIDRLRGVKAEMSRATIVSDGCRDYVVHFETRDGDHVLSDRRGRPKRFASLAQAKSAVSEAREIRLAVRIAADEVGVVDRQPRSKFCSNQLSQRIA